MTRFLLRRLGGLVVTLLISSFVVFASLYLAPGSPEAVLFGGRTPTPDARAAIRAQYHLDDPFWRRYVDWLGSLLRGDLGTSVVGHQPVATRVGSAVGTTLWLVAFAAILIIVVGVGLGLLAALRPGWVDSAVSMFAGITVGVPAFVAASVGIAVFAVRLQWFPAFGSEPGFLGRLHSLILPAISLALLASSLVTRVTRASVRRELEAEYVQTATARAVPRRVIIWRHVMRNAAGPILTAGGLQIAALFAGTLVVESAFGLSGLGSLLVNSINQKDFPTVQAVALLMVTAFVLTNLVVDVLHAAIDPRLRLAATRGDVHSGSPGSWRSGRSLSSLSWRSLHPYWPRTTRPRPTCCPRSSHHPAPTRSAPTAPAATSCPG
jgi:peptide/nickel transport system permease protein